MVGLIVFLLIWFVCGAVSAGYTFAHYQREYALIAAEDRRFDFIFAWLAFFVGPVSLPAALLICGTKHGWKWPTLKD